MEQNKALNATCTLNGYLFCQMPASTIEVEVKIKNKWGKYTLTQDTSSRTEKYCSWDRADRRASIHTRKTRTPRRTTVSTDVNTNSETEVPNGEGFGYPPNVFTDPRYAAHLSPTNDEQSTPEETRKDFIGDYCEKCIRKYNRCWCNSSDWDEDLIEIEAPNNNTITNNPIRKMSN